MIFLLYFATMDVVILHEFVGEGAFSKVYLAESKQDKGGLAAVKVINKVKINNIETLIFFK